MFTGLIEEVGLIQGLRREGGVAKLAIKASDTIVGLAIGDSIAVDGVFIEVGSIPATAIPRQIGCEIDAKGFLTVDATQSTNIPGVFGAGDLTNASNYFAQFVTAAGEASVAANSAFNYVSGQHS